MWKAHQRALEIEDFLAWYCAGDLDPLCQRSQQSQQLVVREKSNLRSPFDQNRQISRELDDVAQSLFAKKQNAPSSQLLALPDRNIQIREPAWKIVRFKAPLVVRPPFAVAPYKQLGEGSAQKCVGIVWLESDRLVEARQGLIDPLQFLERIAPVVESPRIIRLD